MTASTLDSTQNARSTVRIWPGVLIMAFYWASSTIPGWLWPGEEIHINFMMFGGMISLALFLVWWLFFSRIRWIERVGLLLACIAVGIGANALAHESYKGMFLFMFAPPIVMTVWVAWLVLSQKLSWPTQRAGLLLAFVLTFGVYTLLRHEGVDGYFSQQVAFRWTPSTEEKYLASADKPKLTAAPAPANAAKPLEIHPGDWPEFRGANRDSRLAGVAIDTNWNDKQPRELWRHLVGPGWSSFCVVGDQVFTQEQHDQKEAVVCYHAYTGNLIWVHHDDERFWDSIGGAGPRATPTFHDGKLYTMGSKGRLNCLDAATGKVVWTRSLVDDTKAAIPDWGFSSSPLVLNGLVTVFSGGPDKSKHPADGDGHNKSIQAYKADTGEKVWESSNTKGSYCSLQRGTLCGVEQLLFVGAEGVSAYEPASGKQLWAYEWDMGEGMNRCTQPAVVSDTDVLIGSGFGKGIRRVHVSREGDKWKAEKVWATKAISPYYNDLVIYKDHAYGVDTGGFLNCVDIKNGERKWKVRGYDNGQVLLLADQGVLVVQCEKGPVALVAARPDKHEELARMKDALDSKTWNHPVISNGKLFVRNGEEAACFELSVK